MMLDLYWPYLAPLIVVCVMTITTGIGPMLRTAIVLLANYVVNTWFVLHFQIYDPWYFYLLIDTFSALVILYRPAGRVQSAIGGTYIAQIVMHAVYGISKFLHPDISDVRYWQVLTIIADAQLLILGVWAGGYWCRAAYRWFMRDNRHLARTQSKGGLA